MTDPQASEPSLFDTPPISGENEDATEADTAPSVSRGPSENREVASEPTPSKEEAASSSAEPTKKKDKQEQEGGGAVYHLIHRLKRAEKHTGDRVVHPRDNRMWIQREGAQYILSLGRGREEYPFTEEAVKQFANLFDVPASLLDTLAGMPRSEVEDCRLLNMLLWNAGARPDAYYHIGIKNNKIVSAHSGKFTPLKNIDLARALKEKQETRDLRVRWYDLDEEDSGVRIEIEHIHKQELDVSPELPGDREADPDLWQPGAIVLNQEQGGRAATIVPTLFRRWGELTLPVVASPSDVHKHRHADTSREALLQNVLKDVLASREAPFKTGAERLHTLQNNMIKKNGVYTYLEGLNWPFPNKQLRNSVVARVTSGRPSLFRLVTATLKLGKGIDDIDKRHRLEMAVGQFVWSRGNDQS